jgi:hypothetical protein
MMNRLVPYAALILALAAFALAAHSGSGPDVQPSSAPAVDMRDLATIRVLEERTAALERELARVSERTAALERRNGGATPTAVAAPTPVAVAPPVPSEARPVPQPLGTPQAREDLKEAVRSVQDEMREEGRRSFMKQMSANLAEGSTERLERWKQFASEMKLNYGQEQALTQAMASEEALRKAISEAVGSGEKNPREAQRELRQKRQETDEAVQKSLDDAQRARYEALRREERRENRGPGGGRGQMR